MNRKAFYNALRGGTMFPRGFTSDQVAGMENLLNVWDKFFSGDSDFLLAYDLGTAFHETAATMQPIVERGPVSYFDKYEPGTKLGKILGNVLKGDGYRFRGEGHVQNTGRNNARKATLRINELFKLGIDLVANPEKRGDPFISAISLFLGNKEGWWTGKDLLDYIDGIAEGDKEDLREFVNARRVVNGTDKANKIGGHALEFYHAIVKARAASQPVASQPASSQPADAPTPPAAMIAAAPDRSLPQMPTPTPPTVDAASPAIRILLRYAAGILVSKGILAPELGTQLLADPEVMMAVQVGAGLLIGAAAEAWYALAHKFGWSK